MLLWLTSALCARFCSDRATSETVRGAWWRQTRALEPGPHFVAVAAVWACVLAGLCVLSGVLVCSFALAMRASPTWPDAHVWAPAAMAPLLCAVVLLCWLGAELAALYVHRRRFHNGLQPLQMTQLDTLSLAGHAQTDDDGDDDDDDL